jgi:non-homologous end joining protein Ku
MTEEFDPAAYEDLHRQRLLSLVERKRDGDANDDGEPDGEAAEPGAESGEPQPAPDLIAALKESLARVRAS